MDQVLSFIRSQDLLAIACSLNESIWIANVYFVADDKGKMFFISPEGTKHSLMIKQNPKVAFSTAWFDPNNHKNRKAVQGFGICRQVNDIAEVSEGLKLLWNKFSDMRDILSPEWIAKNIWGTRLWTIETDYIKYWDDEIYGDDEFAEYNVSRETL
ncbi:pyridoxamine 5'-phosphate oxidase family protein [Candidatus Uhrbacteria bacterium]|nr:pyridoxamine 5'-phosphate oxidase family protein [Candidatus Uhrbacteria bacterium]